MTDNERLNIHTDLRVAFAEEKRFFGPGTVMLLKEIDACGNVREACEKCGFSYSKGWTIIRKCEGKLGYEIVQRQVGGRNGGSATVTEKGRALVEFYDQLRAELIEIAELRLAEQMEKHNLF